MRTVGLLSWIPAIAVLAAVAIGATLLFAISLVLAAAHDLVAWRDRRQTERARRLVEALMASSMTYGQRRHATVSGEPSGEWPSRDETTAIAAIGARLGVPPGLRSYKVTLPRTSASASLRAAEASARLEADVATLGQIAAQLRGRAFGEGRSAIERIARGRLAG